MSDAVPEGGEQSGGVMLLTQANDDTFQGPRGEQHEGQVQQEQVHQEQQQEQQQQEQQQQVQLEQLQKQQEKEQEQEQSLPKQPRTHIAIAEAPNNDLSRASVISMQPAHLSGASLAAVLTLLLERRKRVELNMTLTERSLRQAHPAFASQPLLPYIPPRVPMRLKPPRPCTGVFEWCRD
jgi:hypothetical protein